VLAATFGALGTIPILFLQQIAFLVAFGVLLDTLVVRSLLVPAVGYDLGAPVWWPSALTRRGEAAPPEAPEALHSPEAGGTAPGAGPAVSAEPARGGL
jgi:RND superfamily putative drug exporter